MRSCKGTKAHVMKRRKLLRHKSGCRKFGKRYAARSMRRLSRMLSIFSEDAHDPVIGQMGVKQGLYHLIIINW